MTIFILWTIHFYNIIIIKNYIPSKSLHLLFAWKGPIWLLGILDATATTLWIDWLVVDNLMSTSPWLLSCVGVPPPGLPSTRSDLSTSNLSERSIFLRSMDLDRDLDLNGVGDLFLKRALWSRLSGPSRNLGRIGDVLRLLVRLYK